MNWKTYLDRYLTTPPEDSYDNYWHEVVESFTDEFYETYEDAIQANDPTTYFNKSIYKCWKKGLGVKQAAKLIERTCKIHGK